MKRPLLLFSSCLLLAGASFNARAQITVTDIHVVLAGNEVIQAQDTLPGSGIQPGSAGTAQTWDFSGLNNHTEDTLHFKMPGWTPYDSYHPTSNLAAQQGSDDFYIFLLNNSSGLYMEGFSGDLMGTGSAVHAPMNPHEIIAEFPLNYMDSFGGYSEQDITVDGSAMGADSLRIKFTKNKTSNVDAWGSVTTPMGTFDALRINEYSTETDSAWAFAFGMWTLVNDGADTTQSYAWWTNDASAGFPLVEMSYDVAAGVATSASYLKATPAISVVENEFISLKVFPNPATEGINFSFENAANKMVEVYALSGELLSSNVVGGNNLWIDLADYTSGLYLYKIKEPNGAIVGTGKFTVK